MHCGRRSKEICLKRFVALDDLFFEGLGLWLGEGGKDKGLYFGNSSTNLILRFLKFVDAKLGINRSKFRVTINSPAPSVNSKKKWSDVLRISIMNFTNICLDTRINHEYAQVYLNSIILVELMKNLQKKLEPMILSNGGHASSFLRGMFAAEGQVAFRKNGSFHITLSSADLELVSFLKKVLQSIGISSGKYILQARKFPVYGYRNLKRFKELNIHTLHPDKRENFERGFASYKRINVLHGDEARGLILKQLTSGPKTYDDLAAALGKARTTIQAHHIPVLEREGKILRAGKRGQAWLWKLAEPSSSELANEANLVVSAKFLNARQEI